MRRNGWRVIPVDFEAASHSCRAQESTLHVLEVRHLVRDGQVGKSTGETWEKYRLNMWDMRREGDLHQSHWPAGSRVAWQTIRNDIIGRPAQEPSTFLHVISAVCWLTKTSFDG